jgi:membrane protein implicated in regulation of membrane protease activity
MRIAVLVMENQLGFVLKVFLLSAGISVLIKYALPYLTIPATATNALIIVLLPTVIMAILLLWRWQQQQN